MSRPSLWADLDCMGVGRTRVYLERSKSSPINLKVHRNLSLSAPFFKFVPPVDGRLKSLHLD